MPSDILPAATTDVNNAASTAAGENQTALRLLQQEAGLAGPAACKNDVNAPSAIDQVLSVPTEGPVLKDQEQTTISDGKIAPPSGYLPLESASPTEQQKADAEKALENRMSKLIPASDRAAMAAITTALINGDTKAFTEILKTLGGDPKKLQALVTEIDKALEGKNCSTRLDITKDGQLLVSNAGSSSAVAFDPVSGRSEAKAVKHNFDGSVEIEAGELLHMNKDRLLKEMGDKTVGEIAGGYYNFSPSPFDQGSGRSRPNPFDQDGDGGSANHSRPHRSHGQDYPVESPQSNRRQPDSADSDDSGLSDLIPQAERVSILAIFSGLAKGDARTLADALKKAGGDAEKLQEMLDELNNMLKKKGSSARLDVMADGRVLVSDTNSGTAIAIDPASGKTEAKAVEHKPDGSILVKPGDLVHVDIDKTLKDLGSGLEVPSIYVASSGR